MVARAVCSEKKDAGLDSRAPLDLALLGKTPEEHHGERPSGGYESILRES